MRSPLVFLLFCLFTAVAFGELPPSAYEAMQAKASDAAKIEVLQVEVEPGESPEQQKVHIVAMVNEVIRTSSGLSAGDLINIYYTVTARPKGWVGPGEIPILSEKDSTIAYLTKNAETDQYAPSAGRMSFSNF